MATVLATPCTAPFLAGAIGFAFTQPPTIIISIFLMAGLGLAAPFVILCWKPDFIKFLPRPGAWTEKFKIAMGFPMLATAVWIYWFTASGNLQLGLFLVIVSAAAWIWGEFVQRGRTRKLMAIIVSFALIAFGLFLLNPTSDEIEWHQWSPEAVSKARAEGHPVLVDFTAKNCINCKVNKASSLEVDETRSKLKEIGAIAFLGDFTREDARIATELRRYERAGVPLVLVYPKDPTAPALSLPPLLTKGIVLEALEKAAK